MGGEVATQEGAASIVPIGSGAVLVRFAEALSEPANRRTIAFAAQLAEAPPDGVVEIAPGLVSVLLRTRPGTDFWRLCGELRLRLAPASELADGAEHRIGVNFDGEDLGEAAGLAGLSATDFVARHNAGPLRVLATGFAPGFVYCGFHGDDLVVPRRGSVRLMVPAGTVLFAAGQTAITATPVRTGWHVIGRTEFQNFDVERDPPTRLAPGDRIRFEAAC